MGAGLAIADFDRNAAPDVHLVKSGRVFGTPATGVDRLYPKRRQGSFPGFLLRVGAPATGCGIGMAVGDFDGGGWIDVFRTGHGGGEVLLRNDGGRR